MSLGTYDLVSLAEARSKRDVARKQVADGTDPAEVKRLRSWRSGFHRKTLLRPLAVSGIKPKPIAGHWAIGKKS